MTSTPNHPKAILSLDIDGTLLDANEQVHPNDFQLLQHFPDEVLLVLNTGRPLHSAKDALYKNGLFTKQKLPMPSIFMNGGVAYFPGEQLYLDHPFDPAAGHELLQLTAEFPNTEFVFFAVDIAFLVNPTPFGGRIINQHGINAIGKADFGIVDNIIKALALNDDAEILEMIREKAKGMKAEMSYSLPFIFEFNPPGITKATTLMQLLEKMELQHLPVFAAGDGENDLSLFTLAKRSFTPDTAHPAILERADQIIARNKNGLLQPILEQIIK